MASSVAGVKGLYEKRGWFYYQPPTPKDGPGKGVRPKAVALKTQDLATALERMEDAQSEATLERVNMDGTLAEVLPIYYAAKASDAKSTRRCRQMALAMVRSTHSIMPCALRWLIFIPRSPMFR